MLDVGSLIHTNIDKPTLCCVHCARRNDRMMHARQKKIHQGSADVLGPTRRWGDLVEALPFFTKLKKLHLRKNEIGDAGAKNLAAFLGAHIVFRHLWIDNTGMFFLSCAIITQLCCVTCGSSELILDWSCKGLRVITDGSLCLRTRGISLACDGSLRRASGARVRT